MNAYQELQIPDTEWVATSVEGLQAFFDASFCKQPKASNPSPLIPAKAWPHQNLHVRPRPEARMSAVILDENLQTQMAEFAKREALFKEILQHYVLPSDSSVTDFLMAHRTIPQILLGAVPQLKGSFGGNAIFHLRAPIDDSGVRTLYAVAIWPGKLSDVRAALANFDDQWWIANSPQAAGHLVFTYELV